MLLISYDYKIPKSCQRGVITGRNKDIYSTSTESNMLLSSIIFGISMALKMHNNNAWCRMSTPYL